MDSREESRMRMRKRHEVGIYLGYGGLFMGLMALLSTTSEGTPFAPGTAAFVVLGFMVGGYLIGWALGPVLSRLTQS